MRCSIEGCGKLSLRKLDNLCRSHSESISSGNGNIQENEVCVLIPQNMATEELLPMAKAQRLMTTSDTSVLKVEKHTSPASIFGMNFSQSWTNRVQDQINFMQYRDSIYDNDADTSSTSSISTLHPSYDNLSNAFSYPSFTKSTISLPNFQLSLQDGFGNIDEESFRYTQSFQSLHFP
jgi:hypothetical protein